MRHSKRKTNITTTVLALALLVGWSASPAPAQAPPSYSPEQLDRLVSRIALYPDPLLAQLLAAATFSNQIPDAAKWADEHHYLTGTSSPRPFPRTICRGTQACWRCFLSHLSWR